MPVTNLLTSAASFFYAVSTMLNGANNNANLQQSFVSNFQSSPTHFIPLPGGSVSGSVSNYPRNGKSLPNSNSNSNSNFYNTFNYSENNNELSDKYAKDFAMQQMPGNTNNYYHHQYRYSDPAIASTIFFPIGISSTHGNIAAGYQSQPQPTYYRNENSNAALPPELLGTGNNGDNNNAPIIPGPIEISYHDGETIATLFTDEYGNVTRCEMLEVNKPSEQQEALAALSAQKKLIEKTNFNTMLNIIRACQALDRETNPPNDENRNPIEAVIQQKINMWTIVSGILPGTKWCGVRDIASGWNDLGAEKSLDKCCRSHDLCPRKVLAFRAAYGLVNWSFATRSHCECDAAFYDCLKGASRTNPTAEIMGNFYFNVLKMQCIEEENAPLCLRRSVENGQSCAQWVDIDTNDGKSIANSQKFVFRDVKQLFR